jgi:hypothetical protein
VEIIPSGQGCAGARLFLSFFIQKVGETTALALMLIAAMEACDRIEPRPLSPEQITSNFESRTLDNPNLKEFF